MQPLTTCDWKRHFRWCWTIWQALCVSHTEAFKMNRYWPSHYTQCSCSYSVKSLQYKNVARISRVCSWDPNRLTYDDPWGTEVKCQPVEKKKRGAFHLSICNFQVTFWTFVQLGFFVFCFVFFPPRHLCSFATLPVVTPLHVYGHVAADFPTRPVEQHA